MNLITEIESLITLATEVNKLKVALGFTADDSIADIITKVEAVGTALTGVATVTATTAATTQVPAAE